MTGAIVLLLSAVSSSFAVDAQLPFDSTTLREVGTVELLPKSLMAALQWHRGGPDGIADKYDKFIFSGSRDLPRRRLVAAGVSSDAAVVIYEQVDRPAYFALALNWKTSNWEPVGAWALDRDLGNLRDFLFEVDTARYGDSARHFLEDRRHYRTEMRIVQTRPMRRNSPLREANLSDIEARDIERVMSQVVPGTLLNISEVVTGCPCEEGPNCMDQVWVVPEKDVETPGVLLSRISSQWKVGSIQKWWMDRARLESDPRMTYSDRRSALSNQWKDFPQCSEAATGVQSIPIGKRSSAPVQSQPSDPRSEAEATRILKGESASMQPIPVYIPDAVTPIQSPH